MLLVVTGCATGDEPEAVTTSTTSSTATTSGPSSTTTVAVPTTTHVLPPVPTGGEVRAVATATGVVAPVLGPEGAGFRVRTPCGNQAVVTGATPLYGATVVLDPGHGGDELGAEGANGLNESDANLAVAGFARDALERAGASVVVTRTSDVRMTLETRAEIATRLAPAAFVSVHHNAAPDGPSVRPGTETYFQHASPESRRLAGLVQEEVSTTFATYEGVPWMGDTDAGAKPRLNARGGDYYGVLRRTAGVPGVISEGLFMSNRAEAELIAHPDVQRAEGQALARAVLRFLTSPDPGSGFVDPYPRTDPAGPGGGATGCVDPPL